MSERVEGVKCEERRAGGPAEAAEPQRVNRILSVKDPPCHVMICTISTVTGVYFSVKRRKRKKKR